MIENKVVINLGAWFFGGVGHGDAKGKLTPQALTLIEND